MANVGWVLVQNPEDSRLKTFLLYGANGVKAYAILNQEGLMSFTRGVPQSYIPGPTVEIGELKPFIHKLESLRSMELWAGLEEK